MLWRLGRERASAAEEVVTAVRAEVGDDHLLGVRLSAADFNCLPLNLRWPPVWPPRDYFCGNTLDTTLRYGEWLADLGVDYLHIDSRLRLRQPKGSPGPYPFEGLRLFSNSARHLSTRPGGAPCCSTGAEGLAPAAAGHGLALRAGANAEFARAFKRRVNLPVIANGGFQDRDCDRRRAAIGRLRPGGHRPAAAGEPGPAEALCATTSVPPSPAPGAASAARAPPCCRSGATTLTAFKRRRRLMQEQILRGRPTASHDPVKQALADERARCEAAAQSPRPRSPSVTTRLGHRCRTPAAAVPPDGAGAARRAGGCGIRRGHHGRRTSARAWPGAGPARRSACGPCARRVAGAAAGPAAERGAHACAGSA
jgi:hypothetical protein